ncbi:hypothetical protein Cocul_02218 [Corynebacterium oculi]|uniref:Uncharacterized protein n=1 Tax=Corynebacterium oculi TaxID=1544416 RepID=A0A0Q0YBD1_9CORY|nr:hypothetical protein Cocul_02218 [Corynebacterium oculi]
MAWYEENPESAPEIPDPLDLLGQELESSLDEALGGLF